MNSLRYRVFREYQKMPQSIVRAIGAVARLLPKRLILGKEFLRWSKFLDESQWWDEEKIQTYQNEQVRLLIAHAYENVPFYRREMDTRGLKPKDIETTADMPKLPIVNKQMMLENPDDFQAKGFDTDKTVKLVTGGSSGTPLHFFWPANSHIIERAFVVRFWNWGGYNMGDRRISIRAKRDPKSPSFYDSAQNVFEMYPTVLDESFVKNLAKTARKFKPKVLSGYSSYLYAIMVLIGKLGLEDSFRSVQVCFSASEKVYSEQRKAVEDVLGVKLFDFYAMGEQIAFFGQCEQNKHMHDSPEHSYTEFLRPEGTPAGHGEQAMVVGTAFLNYAWPMIRYSIGDVAETTGEICSCGRKSRLLKEVYGRCGDFVLTPSGRLISPTSLSFALRYLRDVPEIQIVQKEVDELQVLIVPGAKYRKNIGEFFAKELLDRVGEPMKIEIELVDKIERPWSEKKRFVKSELGRASFGADNKN